MRNSCICKECKKFIIFNEGISSFHVKNLLGYCRTTIVRKDVQIECDIVITFKYFANDLKYIDT